MLLTSILCVPLLVGLLCLVARPRVLLEALNIVGFTPSASVAVKPTMLSASSKTRGRATRQSSPTSSGTQRMEVSSMASSFEFVQLAHVHRVERLADAEDQQTQHHHADDHVEEDGHLHDQRHSV